MTFTEPLPAYLAEPSRIGDEISITGKWVPSKPGGRFRTTEESREMLHEWEDIHQGARADALRFQRDEEAAPHPHLRRDLGLAQEPDEGTVRLDRFPDRGAGQPEQRPPVGLGSPRLHRTQPARALEARKRRLA